MTSPQSTPKLLTAGRIALALDEPLHRVVYILKTRGHIQPAARAGTLRLYRESAVAQVRQELALARRRREGGRP